RLSNLEDIIEQFNADVGDLFLNEAKQVVTFFTNMISAVREQLHDITEIVKVGISLVTAYFIAFKAGGLIMAGIQFAVNNVARAVWALNAAWAANPIGVVIVSVVALIGAVRVLNTLLSESAKEAYANAEAASAMIEKDIKQTEVDKTLAETKETLLKRYRDLKKEKKLNTE